MDIIRPVHKRVWLQFLCGAAVILLALLLGRYPCRLAHADDTADSPAPAAAPADDSGTASQDDSGTASADESDPAAGDETDPDDPSQGHYLEHIALPQAAVPLSHAPPLPAVADSAASLKRILAEPQFAADDAIDKGDGPLERFLTWAQQLLTKAGMTVGGTTTLLLTIALFGMLAFLIVRLIWELVQRQRRRSFAVASGPRPEDMTAQALLSAAAAALARGEFREALRLRFLALVKQLDLAGTTVQTNSQLMRQVRKAQPAAAAPFAGAVACFEDAWYGGLPCGADNYAELTTLAAEILRCFKPEEDQP